MDYKQALLYIRERRKAALNYALAVYDEALKNCPELAKTLGELSSVELEGIKTNKPNEQRLAELKNKRDTLFARAGIDDKILNPPPFCEKCLDTGFVGKSYCTCVKNAAINSGENLGIALHEFSKSNFIESEYKERNNMVYADIKRICEKYPNTNKKCNILIAGNTGTGKTFLAGCVANELLKRGFSVVAVSAFSFVNRALSYHTTFDENKLAFLTPLIECDLLIIDDLGTESILKNVTIEYLYMVLSERTLSRRLTLITTNLDQKAILDRYNERLYSRLFDKQNSYFNILNSPDMRLKKR